MYGESKDIKLEKLIPFKDDQDHTCEEDWIQPLADCIKRAGLTDPVIVRPADNEKYEIICGHNRIKALEMLGCKVISANIMNELSDENAAELHHNSSFDQQPFSACCYSKRFEIIKHYEEILKKNSCQGKRTDLEGKFVAKNADTYVQPVSNSLGTDKTHVQLMSNISKEPRHPATRDEAAHRLGISTATFSKYRRIIKLPSHLLQSIASLLDEKKITFEAAYIISNMIDIDIEYLIDEINNHPNRKLPLERLKKLPKRNAKESSNVIYTISNSRVLGTFHEST